MSDSKCDKCGAVVSDLDAGFSPADPGMKHSCGGIWEKKGDRKRCKAENAAMSTLMTQAGPRRSSLAAATPVMA